MNYLKRTSFIIVLLMIWKRWFRKTSAIGLSMSLITVTPEHLTGPSCLQRLKSENYSGLSLYKNQANVT